MLMNQQICRCCLVENPLHTYNIFDDSHLRLDLLQFVSTLNIEPEDGLSEVICECCRLRLREALDFRRSCEAAEKELRKRYDDTNKAIEQVLSMDIFEQDAHVGMILEKLVSDDIETETENLSELDNIEVSILDELLFDDNSFNSISDNVDSINSDEQDSTITELLNDVLNDHVFESLTNSNEFSDNTHLTTNDINVDPNKQHHNQHNQENYVHPKDSSKSKKTNKGNAKATQKSNVKSLHPCTLCDKKFTRNFQLKLHMISVHNVGDGLQYKCLECQKTFASRHSLKYHHKSIHSLERPYACTQCERRFVLRTQLSSHMRTHTGESKPRTHECDQCKKKYLTKSDLRTHMRSHDPDMERPFKCDRCEKCFFTRGHLNSHLLVHTGEKPFACTFCERSYQSVGNLNNHLVRRHADIIMAHPVNCTALESPLLPTACNA
ncbi:oocyte zinc finger protein XlCOF6.1 [Teleopsis dalmanni]|uniref:oocyte zinc finger protein XlCOF6.1 n=1 Tax=Teleopsis dalmanni TaxID=139649 RepID=UPI0018CC8B2A|nr:oocyte zinc finger protein XlCOF6.1 [Teleopsis dalmanni]